MRVGFDMAGSVYIFRYNNDEDTWEEEQKLMASDAAKNDSFGYSVALGK